MWEKLRWSWSSMTSRIRNGNAHLLSLLLLHFAFILLHWTPAFFPWQQCDHSRWPRVGCILHPTLKRFPPWPQRQKSWGRNLLFLLRSDVHSQTNQLGWTRYLCGGLCRTTGSASTITVCGRSSWGQCLDGPVAFLNCNTAKCKWH